PGRQIGHFFWAVDVTAFGPRDEFLARVDEQIEQIKARERLEGIAGQAHAPVGRPPASEAASRSGDHCFRLSRSEALSAEPNDLLALRIAQSGPRAPAITRVQ